MQARRRFAALSVLLLGAAAGRGAEPPAAPLSGTKQELRELERNRSGAGKDQPGGALKLDTPTLPAPGQTVVPFAPSRTVEQMELEKKQQKALEKSGSWLVNGVRELEKEEKQKTDPAAARREQEQEQLRADPTEKVDRTDPNYLLKLFDEQKREKTADAKAKPSTTPDPLAPFLQDWLGNSPVRGQFFDQFAKRSEPGTVEPALSPGSAPGLRGPVSSAPAREPLAVDRPNPYLTELPQLSAEAARPQPPANLSGPANTGLGNVPVRTPGPVVDPAPPPRETPKTPPLPTKPDSEKYFPQLKKF